MIVSRGSFRGFDKTKPFSEGAICFQQCSWEDRRTVSDSLSPYMVLLIHLGGGSPGGGGLDVVEGEWEIDFVVT